MDNGPSWAKAVLGRPMAHSLAGWAPPPALCVGWAEGQWEARQVWEPQPFSQRRECLQGMWAWLLAEQCIVRKGAHFLLLEVQLTPGAANGSRQPKSENGDGWHSPHWHS